MVCWKIGVGVFGDGSLEDKGLGIVRLKLGGWG